MGIKIENYETDKVYLFQFARAKCFISLSPYSAKLETYLRIADIPYETISQLFMGGGRGQKPYIEINGEEVCDSTNVINFLSKHFDKGAVEQSLSPMDAAVIHAMDQMIESILVWQMLYFRSFDFEKSMFSSEQGMLDVIPLFFQYCGGKLVGWVFSLMIGPRLTAQGVGRRPYQENVDQTIENLKAFSVFLGDKTYMAGEKASRFDATAFGIIGQLYFTPMENEVVTFVKESNEFGNIRRYLENMKRVYWPDWPLVCGQMQMNTEWRGMRDFV